MVDTEEDFSDCFRPADNELAVERLPESSVEGERLFSVPMPICSTEGSTSWSDRELRFRFILEILVRGRLLALAACF